MRRYAAGESSGAIAAALGLSKPTVLLLLHRAGVDLRPSAAGRRRYRRPRAAGFRGQLDDWHAYWLGFLAAHGSIQRTPRLGHRMTVEVRGEDAAHLDELRVGLDTDAPLRQRRSSVVFILIDREMCDVLSERGVGVRTRMPQVDPAERRPVLRGYWDAHGTLSRSQRSVNANVVAGSHRILEELQGWFGEAGVLSLGIWRLTGESRMLALSRARDNLLRLHDLLYSPPCTVYLPRQRRRLEAVLGTGYHEASQ